jgi:hypothetical protein
MVSLPTHLLTISCQALGLYFHTDGPVLFAMSIAASIVPGTVPGTVPSTKNLVQLLVSKPSE